MQLRGTLSPITTLRCNHTLLLHMFSSLTVGGNTTNIDDDADDVYADIPRPRKEKSQRKPYITPMKVLIKQAKDEKQVRKELPCRLLQNPPDNGLLVPELIPVAHSVCRARKLLLSGLSKLTKLIPVHRCRFCSEVHIGHVGHEIRTCCGPNSSFRNGIHVWRKGGVHDIVLFPKCYHLYDRVGKPRVVHNERYEVPQISAILELCIQAGVDIEKYPAKRRTKPVYSIEGRIVDFESVTEKDQMRINFNNLDFQVALSKNNCAMENNPSLPKSNSNEFQDVSVETMNSWFEMISGVKKIMEKYKVWTCGYCPEVQVGPKGHKVRICKASKHQSRDGMHAWQEAGVEDIVGPNYVWHVRDLNGPALDNNLKRFYGKAPAVVELCVHGGALVPYQYRSMMRLDVVPPNRDEADLVA
ncbi:hypothetical protein ACFE04_019217 [Oxalis oulophora]